MSAAYRLPDYLGHMQQAAADACGFVEGLAKEDFLNDKRTQQAVIMNLIIIGEAVAKVMHGYPAFTQAHGQVPWNNMRGMRNRMAHGYFDIDLEIVWDTVQTALPDLLQHLPALRADAEGVGQNGDTKKLQPLALRQSRKRGRNDCNRNYYQPQWV